MDVDVSVCQFPVHCPEAEPTDATSGSMCFYALTAGLWVALVGVDGDGTHCPFDQAIWLNDFFS